MQTAGQKYFFALQLLPPRSHNQNTMIHFSSLHPDAPLIDPWVKDVPYPIADSSSQLGL